METGGARVLVAADRVAPESEVLAAEDMVLESEEVTAEDVVDSLLSVDSDPLLSITQDSQEPDEVVPESEEVTTEDVVPNTSQHSAMQKL